MKKRPGVMLYFDRMTFLDRLDMTQRGELITAIIDYARDGAVPEINDPMLGMAWDVLRPVLDLDAERYEAICERNRRNGEQRKKKPVEASGFDWVPNTNTDTDINQTQTQTQIESEIQTQTKTHSQSQKETGRDFSDSESLEALTARRRREWAAEKKRLADSQLQA